MVIDYIEGSWGGLASVPDAPEHAPTAVPEELSDLVDAIREQAPRGARDLTIRYAGEHRQVKVIELVPPRPFAEAEGAPSAVTSEATFAADVAHRAGRAQGSRGRLWRVLRSPPRLRSGPALARPPSPA